MSPRRMIAASFIFGMVAGGTAVLLIAQGVQRIPFMEAHQFQRDTAVVTAQHSLPGNSAAADKNPQYAASDPLAVDSAAAQISPAAQLADCKSAVPVVALNGNRTDAKKSRFYVYDFYCVILSNDPATFVALNTYYGKDGHSVYTITEDDNGITAHKIEGADPKTFHLIPDAKNPNSVDGYSRNYTGDRNHVYWDGYLVPAINSIKLVYPPKSCTTCIFDAQVGESNFYYRGQLLGSSLYE